MQCGQLTLVGLSPGQDKSAFSLSAHGKRTQSPFLPLCPSPSLSTPPFCPPSSLPSYSLCLLPVLLSGLTNLTFWDMSLRSKEGESPVTA